MPGKVPALDGLRGLAVLLVVLLHFGYLSGGWIGVQVFFVLSGFLITRILRAELGTPLGPFLRRFYFRRALRILPLYALYLGLLAMFWNRTGVPAALPDVAASLATYTFNFTRLETPWAHSPFLTHFWSLSVEEQFYLAWPFVVFFAGEKVLRTVCAVMVFAGPLVRLATASVLAMNGDRSAYDVGDSVYWMPWSHADAFATGAWLSLLPAMSLRTAARGAALFTGTAVAAGLLNLRALEAAGADLRRFSLGFPLASIDNLQHAWSYTVLNLMAAAWIALALASHQQQGMVAKVLGASPLSALGRMSYGVYVLHWPLLALFNAQFRYRVMTLRGLLCFLLYFALVCLVAHVSFRWFESPFLALKDRAVPLPLPLPERALARAQHWTEPIRAGRSAQALPPPRSPGLH